MNNIKKIHFCPNCRMRVDTPKMLLNPNMNIGGNININCGNCNKDGKNPKGVIKIKGNKIKEEPIEEIETKQSEQ